MTNEKTYLAIGTTDSCEPLTLRVTAASLEAAKTKAEAHWNKAGDPEDPDSWVSVTVQPIDEIRKI